MIYKGFMATGLFETLVLNYSLDGTPFAMLLAGLTLFTIALSYLLGSLNFAVIISKIGYGEDIREHGSGNGGMTNMLRTYGKGAAGLTLLGDAMKTAISVTVGCALLGMFYGGYLAGFFCMMGHMFPIYYRFKGGKGVVTVATMALLLNPLVFAVLLLVFIIIVAFTKYVSLGSVMSVMLYPVFLNRLDAILMPYYLANNVVPGTDTIFAVLIALCVVFMHRANIKRLLSGTESKISFGKKGK